MDTTTGAPRGAWPRRTSDAVRSAGRSRSSGFSRGPRASPRAQAVPARAPVPPLPRAPDDGQGRARRRAGCSSAFATTCACCPTPRASTPSASRPGHGARGTRSRGGGLRRRDDRSLRDRGVRACLRRRQAHLSRTARDDGWPGAVEPEPFPIDGTRRLLPLPPRRSSSAWTCCTTWCSTPTCCWSSPDRRGAARARCSTRSSRAAGSAGACAGSRARPERRAPTTSSRGW